MSLKRYLDESGSKAIASEIGFYTPLATHVFGALLGYPSKHRVINKSGKHGIPDIRLYSQEDGSEWVVVEAKLDDTDIRKESQREKIWRDQVLEHGYIGPETYYVVLCAPRTFYVCDLDGEILEALEIEDDHLVDPRGSAKFPLTDKAFRERMYLISYAASLERRQFKDFREGKLKSGHIPLTPETLPQLQSTFAYATEKLHEYCRFRFRELRAEYAEVSQQIRDLQKRVEDVGSGAVKTRAKLRYRMLTLQAEHELALQIFDRDYDRFKHDQTYAGTHEEEAFEDIFCTNTAYVALSRLIFVRICEDVGLTTRKISNSGIAVWRDFVQNIKEQYQDLLDVAFKDVAHVYSSLFESSVFDWFGLENGVLHGILERILFRLNAFTFKEMNRDVLGSMYQYFRPKIERRRLGEYYTPTNVVDYILARTGFASDSHVMQARMIDPACGSFTFGVRAAARLLDVGSYLSAENRIDLVRTRLRGQDINPFSTFLAHLSLLFALLPAYLEAKKSNPKYEIKPMAVSLQNSLTLGLSETVEMGSHDEWDVESNSDLESSPAFEYVVGNPPFVRNERIPKQDRAVLYERFPVLAIRNTDLSVYFLYVAVKYLAKEGGTIGMVAPVGIANAQMAAYLRNFLKAYEIFELVSLEWCAKQVFPGADIVPMLIFLRKKTRAENHAIRLVRGITNSQELEQCAQSPSFLASKSSLLPFDEWAALNPSGDWCLDVSEHDLPMLRKLNALPSVEEEDAARCCFAVKAGNHQQFLRAVKSSEAHDGEVPFVKGQHIAAFHTALEVDELADLGKIDTAEDGSIWSSLAFYESNEGQADDTGLGRTDYKTPNTLAAGSPSDTLCCLVPEVYVTLTAAVVDPLSVVANNSVIAVVPKKYSAHCWAAIINSRVSRYFSFHTSRAAILLRRRTTWYPRAIKALRLPRLEPEMARSLHKLAVEASDLAARGAMSVADLYSELLGSVTKLTKAGFLGLQVPKSVEVIDRDDLAPELSPQLPLNFKLFEATDPDLDLLVRTALLASEQDEFAPEEIENVQVPAEAAVRREFAEKIRGFANDLKKTQDRVLTIMENIDEIVAEGLGLTAAEHETIRKRCQEFPLSVTVERPRFAWSPDRKRQARRTYRPGERFK